MPQPILKWLVIAGALLLTILSYLPGATNHFIFDDGTNIVHNRAIQIDALTPSTLKNSIASGNAGLLKRPLSMMSFALNYYFSGMNARYFKLTNLAIHIVNGILVFIVCHLLLTLFQTTTPTLNPPNAFLVSGITSAMWLLHPLNLTSVLYVVQRMTSLATLFVLLGIAFYLWGRKQLLNDRKYGYSTIFCSIAVFTPLAALSKENGALLPLFIVAIEVLVLKWKVSAQEKPKTLLALVGVLVLMPVLFGLLYLWVHPELIYAGYQTRDFSLTERLMTEPRVLWFYLYLILLPNMGVLGLYHDDLTISHNLFSPWTTLPSIAGLLLACYGAYAYRKKYPFLSLGIAFFLLGHSLESSIFPLEIAFEYRNYLPMLGIILAAVYYLASPQLQVSTLRIRKILLILMVFAFAGLTALRAQQWGDPLIMRMLEVERHPLSLRANTDIAGLYNNLPARSPMEALDYYSKAAFHYQAADNIDPSNLTGLLGLLVLDAQRNIEPSPSFVGTLEQRLSKAPFNPPNVNSLVGAIKCIAYGNCSVPPEVMGKIIQAALANPTLPSTTKNYILTSYSDFVFRKPVRLPESRLAAYRFITNSSIDLSHRINLTHLLLEVNEPDLAKQEIQRIRQLDKSNSYEMTLHNLELEAEKKRAN